MKLTLMIEGSASALAAILAALPGDGSVSVAPAPAPVAMPMPIPAPMPMPANPTGGDEDGDDDGPVNAAAGATDAHGMPWDERIHASTKGTNTDGSWRYRRGVPKEAIAAVEAELRAAGHGAPVAAHQAGAPAPVAMPMPIPAPMPLPAADPMPVMAPPAPLPVAAAMPLPDPAATAYPVPGAVAAPSPLAAVAPSMEAAVAQQPAPVVGLDFAQFMQHLSGQMQKRDAAGAPLVHADYLAGITAEIGSAFQVQLNAITDIATDPNKINYAVQLMQRDGRW